MQFNRRTVTSRAGMGQEEALLGLQSHPEFKEGSTIAGIRRRGERWVISVLEPKDDMFSEGLDLPEDKPEEKKPDNPFDAIEDDKGPSEKPDHEDSELSEIKELIKDVKKIIDALGINSEDEGHKAPGMEDAPAPAPAPPHPAPPKGNDEKEVTLNKSMRPGEAPPGTVNVGSPAFASTRVASFTATSDDTFNSIKQAKASLESEFGPHGYKVKQLRRSEGKIHALLSVR